MLYMKNKDLINPKTFSQYNNKYKDRPQKSKIR